MMIGPRAWTHIERCHERRLTLSFLCAFCSSRLREIFLKYNNYNRGQFLAEVTQQVFDDLDSNKYQFAEYRLSIYGSAKSEWDTLADWVGNHRLFHYNVRWMIQIPRLYAVYRAMGKSEGRHTSLVARSSYPSRLTGCSVSSCVCVV